MTVSGSIGRGGFRRRSLCHNSRPARDFAETTDGMGEERVGNTKHEVHILYKVYISEYIYTVLSSPSQEIYIFLGGKMFL